MIIQSNISTLYGQKAVNKMNKAAERLGSGYKLNRAADNVAGLVISESMRGQIRGLVQAGENVQDGVSLIQTAESAMGDIENIIHRVRELSVQASNDTYTDDDRQCMNEEAQSLLSEVDRIAENTEFNTMKLLNGEWSKIAKGKKIPIINDSVVNFPGFWSSNYKIDLSNVQDGAIIEIDGLKFEFDLDGIINDPVNNIPVDIRGATTKEKGEIFETVLNNSPLMGNYDSIYGLHDEGQPLNISFIHFVAPVNHKLESYPAPDAPGKPIHIQLGPNSQESLEMYVDQVTTDALSINTLKLINRNFANNAIALAENALGWLSNARASLGALQNRLEHAANHIDNYEENLSTAESKIRDADMAKEVADYHKSNVLVQTAHSVQSQSEKSAEGVLRLLE